MGTISTGIELNDNFSSVLYNIMGSVNLAIYQMEEMRQSLSASIDTSYIEGARESIDRATMSLREMEEAASVSVAPAMSSMDVSAANSNYEQLRQNVESTGQHIRDNAEEQQRFNQAVNSGTTSSNNLLKGLIGLHVVQSVVNTVTGQIDAAMKRMDTMTNFQRTMTAITGSSDMAAASLNQLKDITTGTAYGLDVAAMAVQNFTTRLLAYFLGGWDVLLKTIVFLAVADYVTGLIKAVYLKQLSSEVGYKGLLKKILMFIIIAVAFEIQKFLNHAVALREIVITFYVCNEAISLLENAAEFIPIPEKLKEVLIQLRDKEEL